MNDNFFSELIEFIGCSWVQNQLDKTRPVKPSNKLKAHVDRPIHPFISFIDRFRKAKHEDRDGTRDFGIYHFIQQQLPQIKRIEGVDHVVLQLRSQDSFWPTCAELLLGYLLTGFEKKVCFKKPVQGQPTPDLEIIENNFKIAAECKSLSALNEKRRAASNQFPLIMNKILNALEKANKKLDVYVRFPDVPDMTMIDDCIRQIPKINETINWFQTGSYPNIEMWTKFSAATNPHGKHILSSLPKVAHPYNSWFEIVSKVKDKVFLDYRFVGMEVVGSKIDLSNVESRVSSSIKQFSTTAPNVLSIFFQEKPEESDIDIYSDWFSKKFEHGLFTRISTVILFYFIQNTVQHNLKFMGAIPITIGQIRYHEIVNNKAKYRYRCLVKN